MRFEELPKSEVMTDMIYRVSGGVATDVKLFSRVKQKNSMDKQSSGPEKQDCKERSCKIFSNSASELYVLLVKSV